MSENTHYASIVQRAFTEEIFIEGPWGHLTRTQLRIENPSSRVVVLF
jgi:hypothetical protein